MKNLARLKEFRQKVYTVGFTKRADALLNLVDALTVAGHVSSPVALSEEVLFERQHSSIPEALNHGQIDRAGLGQVLYDLQPAEAETMAGYEVYAADTTPEYRPEAETLPDRGYLKSKKEEMAQPGHQYSWLVRLVKQGTSWVAPQDVGRVRTDQTESQVAVEQVKTLDQRSDRPKVVVADSRYANKIFLAVFLVVKTIVGLVRLRQNMALYEAPTPKPAGSVGRPRKHGAKFKLSCPARSPERSESFSLFGQTIRLQAWHGLHLRALPDLVGVVLRVEFLKADGTPRYKRPLWLFWTGSVEVALSQICLMYLWRFAEEHAFRFLKQHLGLTANNSTQLGNVERWMWLGALAYWQLLLLQEVVIERRPAWYPARPTAFVKILTPGLVQRAALSILGELDGPAQSPKPTGKGVGRPKGYCPQPRKRYQVVKKGKKKGKSTQKTPVVT